MRDRFITGFQFLRGMVHLSGGYFLPPFQPQRIKMTATRHSVLYHNYSNYSLEIIITRRHVNYRDNRNNH
jgi:hypothetical protein